MCAHSSILAWRIPCTEEPGGLHSMGCQRVGHDWATNTFSCLPSWDLIWSHTQQSLWVGDKIEALKAPLPRRLTPMRIPNPHLAGDKDSLLGLARGSLPGALSQASTSAGKDVAKYHHHF